MNDARNPRTNRDQDKTVSPDKLRNDKAKWKQPDQPDPPRRNPPDPETDYPDAEVGVPR